MKRRVVVTGMGMVTCLGTGVQTNWEELTAGRSGIGPVTQFDTKSFVTKIAGEVGNGFDPSSHVAVKELRRMDRYQQFALVAAGEAVQDSALSLPPGDPFRYGCVVGSGMGGLWTIESSAYGLHEKGPRACHPLMIPKSVINLAPGMLSIKYGLKGINFGVVTACASGTSAIGEAWWAVRQGRADVMLTGGAEAVVTPLSFGAFNALRALSTRNDEPEKASRPFDADRDGFVIAEGAGMLVLETLEHAQDRGAKIYCEILGYGATGDAYHFVMPDPDAEGAYWAMKIAAEEAGIPPSEINYINAHGTSTELNDKMETLAIKRLLGDAARNVCISSTKSMTGHLIGAAGAVEAIYSIMALNTGVIPPTINLDNPDPACDLDYTPNKAARKDLTYALSNSFAFGGQNASLIFKRV